MGGGLGAEVGEVDVAEGVARDRDDTEAAHRGEIRFALEGALPLLPLMKGATARTRAVQVFSDLRVWDTEENTGVLLYPFFLDGVAAIPELNQGDRIHPTAKGVSIIVERILPSTRP